MSDTLKILGQIAPNATTETDLYTVPASVQTTVSSIVIANRDSGAATYRLSVSATGSATSNKDFLIYDKALSGNTTDTIVIGITLNETDKIRAYASTANLSFNAFGCETSED
tara:strand:+ start:8485 stop:8820 length:336 start_codon:yes stop_codon:yes gene_type:complete